MYDSLPPNQMVCIPCQQCGRDQFIITDAAGQPDAYDGAGLLLRETTTESAIDRLLYTECDDCDRIKSLDKPFIVERYRQTQLFGTFAIDAGNQC